MNVSRYGAGFALATAPFALFLACADADEGDLEPGTDASADDARTLPSSEGSSDHDAGADVVTDADAAEPKCTPGGWCVVPMPEDASVLAVWGHAADDVYFAGEAPQDGGSVPCILHYDGGAVSVVYRGQSMGSFQAIHGTSTGDTWAVGATPQDGPLVARGRRSGEAPVFENVDPGVTSGGLRSLWVAEDDDVWAVASRSPLLRYSAVHGGEPSWHQVSFPVGLMGGGIAGRANGEILVGTQTTGAAFYVGTEGAWSRVHLTKPVLGFDVSGIWQSPSGETWLVASPLRASDRTAIYSTRDGGDVPTLDDAGTWRLEMSTLQLVAVWGSAEDDVWAVGSNGLIVHFDGTAFRISPTAIHGVLSPWPLRSIWGSGSADIWAAGGVVLRRKEGAK